MSDLLFFIRKSEMKIELFAIANTKSREMMRTGKRLFPRFDFTGKLLLRGYDPPINHTRIHMRHKLLYTISQSLCLIWISFKDFVHF